MQPKRMEVERLKPRKRRLRTAVIASLFLAALVLLMALLASGILPRMKRQAELAAAARSAETSVPLVDVVSPHPSAAATTVRLPGTMDALLTAPIFARANGYMRTRLVDIGDRVRTGQLLAEIETPELEQEIRQSRAALEQSRAVLAQKRAALGQASANLQLATATLRRWKNLVERGVFSPQEGDEKQAAYDARKADVEAVESDIHAAEANVSVQQANVQRLEELRGFQKVTAPFDGVITVRNMDPGALITAGSGSNVREIFRLAQIHTLRIFANVPQTHVPSIRAGQDARVLVPEFPRRVFTGKVTRTANALDAASRTLLTEVQIPNPDGVLLPGMYAEVEFRVASANRPLIIPATVLVVRADGSHAVVSVGTDGKARYRKITIGRDFGSEAEVIAGLRGDERLVENPSDDLEDGAAVQVAGKK